MPGDDALRPQVIFTGVAVERSEETDWLDQAWRFAVEQVERGPIEPGLDYTVLAHVRQKRTGDGMMVSSCGVVGDEPVKDRRYRVGGSWDPDTEVISVGLCSDGFMTLADPSAGDGGLATEVGGAHQRPPLTDLVTTTSLPATDATLVAVLDGGGGDGLDGRVVGIGAGAAAGAGVGLLGLWRRRLT